MADKPYLSDSMTINDKGEAVAKPPEAISASLLKVQGASVEEERGKIAGYKVVNTWFDGEYSDPHPVGTVLKAGEVKVPKGLDRAEHIQALLSSGVITPIYAKAEPEHAAPTTTTDAGTTPHSATGAPDNL